MKEFAKLTFFTLGIVIIISAYFEYCVNRPLNIYIQYAATGVIIIIAAFYMVYLVKKIIKLLNP